MKWVLSQIYLPLIKPVCVSEMRESSVVFYFPANTSWTELDW